MGVMMLSTYTHHRKALKRLGVRSALDIPRELLGKRPDRNRRIVQTIVFEGQFVDRVGRAHGCSGENVRVIAKRTLHRVYAAKWGADYHLRLKEVRDGQA